MGEAARVPDPTGNSLEGIVRWEPPEEELVESDVPLAAVPAFVPGEHVAARVPVEAEEQFIPPVDDSWRHEAMGEPPPDPPKGQWWAAWLPDPRRRHEFRYWDGTNWTDHVSDSGMAGIDPV
jgi:hypothetical protein